MAINELVNATSAIKAPAQTKAPKRVESVTTATTAERALTSALASAAFQRQRRLGHKASDVTEAPARRLNYDVLKFLL